MTDEADAAGIGVGVGYLGNGFEEVEERMVVTVDTADSTETSLSVLA